MMLQIPYSYGARSKTTMKIIIIGHRDSLSYLTFSWESRIKWPREIWIRGSQPLQNHMFSFTEIYEVPIFDSFKLQLNLVYDGTLTYCITWWIFFFCQDGDTPLHLACQRKHVAIVDLLLGKFNASINIPNKVSVKVQLTVLLEHHHRRIQNYSVRQRIVPEGKMLLSKEGWQPLPFPPFPYLPFPYLPSYFAHLSLRTENVHSK